MARRSLTKLSDNKLLSDLRSLVKKEKQTTLAILLHLGELDRRELYLSYGFSSLYDYCVGALNYSRSSAARRIGIARCIRRYPEVYDLLDAGEVNLTSMGLVAPILDDGNKDLILAEIRKKTQRQIESIIARFKRPIAYCDRVKPVRVAVPNLGENAKNRRKSLILNSHYGSNRSPANGSGASDGADSADVRGWRAATMAEFAEGNGSIPRRVGGKGGPATRVEKRLLVQFLASEELMAKLDEVKSLLSNKIRTGRFEDVFDVLVDEFLEKHSPSRKQQRREKRAGRKKSSGNRKGANAPVRRTSSKNQAKRGRIKEAEIPERDARSANGNVARRRHKQSPAGRRRGIPAARRDKVYVRDCGQCVYVGKNGKRCRSSRNLQIDHIKPVARGGTNALSNLRLLCGKHNRLEAKRILGADVMDRFTRKE